MLTIGIQVSIFRHPFGGNAAIEQTAREEIVIVKENENGNEMKTYSNARE